MAYTAHFPISSFLDVDGNPLENGYVYIGVAGLDPVANPISVYWDAAATQLAVQPIRTIGGYPSNAGVRSRLYVNATDYSIKVTNINGTDTVPVALYNAEDAYAADIIFLQAGAGAVPRTVESKLRDVVSVKDFGAVGDGVTDDTAALQLAFNTGKSLFFPAGTYIVSSTITATSYNNATVSGNATVKAKDASDFSYLIDFTGTTNASIIGMTFDANKSARGSAVNILSTIKVNTTTNCLLLDCIFQNSLGTASSSVAVSASGGCVGLRVIGCSFLDCGTSALSKPSDGIFIRGDYCVVEGCYAKNVTDTAFVLEGCNYSQVSNCVVESSTGFAAITNDTVSDCVGNIISGITGSCDYVGSTGGVIAIGCFAAGNIRESSVSNISFRGLSGAGGLGPVIQARTTSTGRVVGLSINDVSIDYGAATGAVAQGVYCSDSDDVQINNAYIKLQTGVGASGIRFDGACSNGIVNGGLIDGATIGVYVLNTSTAIIRNAVFKNQTDYGISADNSSVIIESENRFTAFGSAAVNKGASATLKSQFWQSWTPTYSTDIGNAATSFTGTPTTTLAKISRSGNVVTVIINYSGTLKAITPLYVALTLPIGVSPINSTTYSPANILNDVTYETGVVRTLTGSDQLLFYRANLATYSPNASVIGQVSFTFEATN
jgi:hypothetical protein